MVVLRVETFPYWITRETCLCPTNYGGARCSSVVRAFAHGAVGHWIDPSRSGPIELFLVPGRAPRLV